MSRNLDRCAAVAAEAKRQRKAAKRGYVSPLSPEEVVAARHAAEAEARRERWEAAQDAELKRARRAAMLDLPHPGWALAGLGALALGAPDVPPARQPHQGSTADDPPHPEHQAPRPR